MKKILSVLAVLIIGGVAVLLFTDPSDKYAETVAETAAPQKVISTAQDAKPAEEEADAAEVAEGEGETAEESEAPAEEAVAKADSEKASEDETAADDNDVIGKLAKALGNIPNSSIKPAPVPGWYEVANGSAVGYVSADAKYLFDGDLIDLSNRVNLTERRRNDWRKTVVSGVDESKMIIFEPKKVKHTVTVFTDVDCGYCRKLHAEIDDYMAEGIRIRYIFYPLRGEQAKSYKTAEKVWCSEDRNEALTQAKQGKNISAEPCENPVGMHLNTGKEIGIRGTPGMITENGQLLPGYMPAKALLAELEKAEG